MTRMNSDIPHSGTVNKPATVVYACSGCSDAGELADRVARELTRAGMAEMSCLAGIGGRVKSTMAKGEKAERILVIDGCPLNCARKTLELAGLKKFDHLGLHELGLRKGNCPVTEEHIAAGVAAAARLVARPAEKTPTLDMLSREVVAIKKQLTYINCSAEVKALSDVICTSGNAVKIVQAAPAGKDLLFVPDENLGAWVMEQTGRPMTLWRGNCYAHVEFQSESLLRMRPCASG